MRAASKKKLFSLAFISALSLLFLSNVHADEDYDKITPYGDYCKDCKTYGVCKTILSPNKASSALIEHYRNKGYTVGKVRHKGRFIEADIYKDNLHVDKVLFDRKTGRLRSIY
jgi:hypothetical protein